MMFQPKESEFKLMLNNAITWFDELVKINGCQCSTSTFIHNMLVKVYTESQADGKMLWDDEMIKHLYPQAIDTIKREERARVINGMANFLLGELDRRLDNGK